MPPSRDEELERRYRDLFENEVVRSVVDARTPNDAAPVDEDAILDFVRGHRSGACGIRKVGLSSSWRRGPDRMRPARESIRRTPQDVFHAA